MFSAFVDELAFPTLIIQTVSTRQISKQETAFIIRNLFNS